MKDKRFYMELYYRKKNISQISKCIISCWHEPVSNAVSYLKFLSWAHPSPILLWAALPQANVWNRFVCFSGVAIESVSQRKLCLMFVCEALDRLQWATVTMHICSRNTSINYQHQSMFAPLFVLLNGIHPAVEMLFRLKYFWRLETTWTWPKYFKTWLILIL